MFDIPGKQRTRKNLWKLLEEQNIWLVTGGHPVYLQDEKCPLFLASEECNDILLNMFKLFVARHIWKQYFVYERLMKSVPHV